MSRANSLDELRREELLLEYLHQNDIDPCNSTVPEELMQKFRLSDEEQENIRFLANTKPELQDSDSMRDERVGVFLHPRFLPPFYHSHTYHEIKYVLRGTVALSVDGRSVILDEGDFCFITPGTRHCCSVFDSETLLINIEIRADVLRSVFQKVFATENPVSAFYNAAGAKKPKVPVMFCRTEDDRELRDLVKVIYDYKAETLREGYAAQVGEMMVEQLLLLLLQRHSKDFSDGWKTIAHSREVFSILDYINKNAGELSLADLARHFNYSEAYMSRFIKRNTGLSFTDLQRNVRLDMAAELLHNTDLPVSTIIAEVGYAGKSNFYRLFKAKFGVTPAEMRESLRLGNA